jgi:hypothetical protein
VLQCAEILRFVGWICTGPCYMDITSTWPLRPAHFCSCSYPISYHAMNYSTHKILICQRVVKTLSYLRSLLHWQVFENALSHWQGCNTALSESCHTIYWQICDKLICHFLPKFVTKLSGISQGIPYDVIASFWNVNKFEFVGPTDNCWITSMCNTTVFWGI